MEKNIFEVPGISKEQVEKERAQQAKVNEESKEEIKKGTGVKGKKISDLLKINPWK